MTNPDNYELTDPEPVIKTASESLAVLFDFDPKMHPCEEILSCTTFAVVEGSTAITLGSAASATVADSKRAIWTRISAGTAGADSLVRAVVTTNQNNTLQRNRTIQVRTR